MTAVNSKEANKGTTRFEARPEDLKTETSTYALSHTLCMYACVSGSAINLYRTSCLDEPQAAFLYSDAFS